MLGKQIINTKLYRGVKNDNKKNEEIELFGGEQKPFQWTPFVIHVW